MGRSARQLDEPESWPGPWSLSDGVSAVLGLIARNPTLVGGSTAFLVALSFVSANALWYQPHAHSGAFFATRDFLRPGAPSFRDETTILIERPEAAAAGRRRSDGEGRAGDAEGAEFLRRRGRRAVRPEHARGDRGLSGEDGNGGDGDGRREPSRPARDRFGHAGGAAVARAARRAAEQAKATIDRREAGVLHARRAHRQDAGGAEGVRQRRDRDRRRDGCEDRRRRSASSSRCSGCRRRARPTRRSMPR